MLMDQFWFVFFLKKHIIQMIMYYGKKKIVTE